MPLGPPKTGGSWWRGLTECGPLEKGMANHFSILALRSPWTVWKGKMIQYWKRNSPGSVGTQYATGDQWRNNSRKNEGMALKQKQYPVVDVTGDRSKVWCYKEQYCIGTWNVRSMNQGRLKEVKQEMARVNVDILGISELKWTGMGELNSDDHYIYSCGQESLRRNGVAIMVNKRVWTAVLACNLKNDRMISVHFQGIIPALIKRTSPENTAMFLLCKWRIRSRKLLSNQKFTGWRERLCDFMSYSTQKSTVLVR